ncbi:spermidine synthase [Aplysia californica]|uniref:Spermidine synthase n=1 Tax=Aplysia californica TaxID=6500 RepID=A0ABM0JE15_APLCA|nr:spermidine synthase [Aplysia californica]
MDSQNNCQPTNQSKMDGKWYRELNLNWEGYCQSFQVEEVLHNEKSQYQDVLVFKSKSFGNVLVLDGVVQCTERDEFTYQEMITHIPMNLHPNPQKVLVVGGGDGGVVREVLKYESLKEVVLCEIDEEVINVSKKYLPDMADCLTNPKVNIQVRDGVQFIREHPGHFDVIITDAPDPEGVAAALFEKNYYQDLKNGLKPNGVACCQGETPFLDLDLIQKVLSQCKEVFPNVGYAVGHTPTYISGMMGYIVASPDPDLDLTKPLRTLSEKDIEIMKLKYYSSQIHRAAFVLPNYIQKAVKGVIDT